MSTGPTRRAFLGSAAAAVAAGWAGIDLRVSQAVGRSTRVFRAGAFAIDITPQEFPVLVNGGVSEGTADRVVDPLHARCLVLDDGTTQVALAVVDSCMIPRALLDEAKEAAHAATGIPTERMLISATHTHSAPSVCACLGTGCDDRYARHLPGRIAEGIKQAYQNLAPAQIGWAVGQDPTNVFCRRYLMKPGTALTNPFSGTQNDQAQMNPGYQNPNAIKRLGPVDPAVTILSVQSPEGRPVALLANYSTHYAGSPAVSADYFGVFCEKIARRVGADGTKPPFVAMMSNGTSGNANCLDFDHPRRQFDYFSVAEDVSRAAHQAYQQIQYHDWVPLAMRQKLLELNVRRPSPEEVTKAREYIAANLGERKPRTWPEVYAWETVLLDGLPPTRELKLQALRIGELGIAAIPCEVYGETGLQIKRDSPLKPTMNISLANGAEGYLPPPEQFPLGGYTTWRARTSCLEVQAEPKITAAVLELLGDVAARPGAAAQLQEAVPEGFVPLFNGIDLQGWTVKNPDNQDWRVVAGVIDCDPHTGPGDRNLWTANSYGDFELLVDWRIKESPYVNRAAKVILPDGTYKKDDSGQDVLIAVPNTDSGVFLRGQHKSQVNIWCWPVGSGEVWGYRTDPALPPGVRAGVTPKVRADRPIGEWNTFRILMKGDRLTVTLNGQPVLDNAQLPGVPARGPLALQHHGDRQDGEWGASFLQFRRIFIKELK